MGDDLITAKININEEAYIKYYQDGKKSFVELYVNGFKKAHQNKSVEEWVTPNDIGERTSFGTTIVKDLNLCDYKQYKKLMGALSEKYSQAVKDAEEKKKEEFKRNQSDYRQKIDEAMSKYANLNNPLEYIGSMMDWRMAGERVNQLIAFITFCSTVILKEPISLIATGRGSSGKTATINSALDLIPKRFVMDLDRSTPSALIRMSQVLEKGSWCFDSVICSFGDLGGKTDQETTAESRKYIANLQTDGHISKTVTVKKDNDFSIEELCLNGKCSFVYSTVPENSSFDSQEESRAIFIQPHRDNKTEYFLMQDILSIGSDVAKEQKEKVDGLDNFIPYVVEGLRELYNGVKFEDENPEEDYGKEPAIQIINPHKRTIKDFIGKNESYKRYKKQFETVIKVITLLNFYEHEVVEYGGKPTIFTNANDIMYFVTLFESYQSSISLGLDKNQDEMYHKILNQVRIANNDGGMLYLEFVKDVTGFNTDDEDWGQTNLDNIKGTGYCVSPMDFANKSGLDIKPAEVKSAFERFEEEGMFEKVYNYNSGDYWIINNPKELENKSLYDCVDFTPTEKKMIEISFPEKIANFILKDTADFSININNQHKDVSIPTWNKDEWIKIYEEDDKKSAKSKEFNKSSVKGVIKGTYDEDNSEDYDVGQTSFNTGDVVFD